MKVPLGKKQTNLEDKKAKSSAFFKHMIDLHMNMDRLRRNITTNILDDYFRHGTVESEKRLIVWGEKAVPKLYILSRAWEDVGSSLRILRILKKMNKPLADTAAAIMSPDMDYNLYFILGRKDSLQFLSEKQERNVTKIYIFSPDKGRVKIK